MKKILTIFLFLIITISIILAVNFFKIFISKKTEGDQFVSIRIERGASPHAIADTLVRNGLLENKEDFLLAVKIFRQHKNLRAGYYKIKKGLSPVDLMKIIAKGETARIKVTIPEGYTSFQIASILQEKLGIDSLKFISLVHDSNFCRELNVEANSLEGYLFPETYFFDWGLDAESVIKRLVAELKKNITDSCMKKIENEGWTFHKILTLASLIEGEAMVDSERSIISAVYRNRLKRGMLLQADPTIQYIIPDGPRRLLNKDLQIDSPYNTYKYPGLPPGPVNNPGIKSIMAAIYPADVPYLYFVAKGDGSHTFSKSLKEHLKAKKRFDEIRRIVKRKARFNGK